MVSAVSASESIDSGWQRLPLKRRVIGASWLFLKGEDPCVTSMKRKRLALLLKHDINLLAYHLPLDVHAIVGNGAVGEGIRL